jgi:hypothetical protein
MADKHLVFGHGRYSAFCAECLAHTEAPHFVNIGGSPFCASCCPTCNPKTAENKAALPEQKGLFK